MSKLWKSSTNHFCFWMYSDDNNEEYKHRDSNIGRPILTEKELF